LPLVEQIPPSRIKEAAMTQTYLVTGMSCDHCTIAVTDEVAKVAGVDAVEVDLDAKLVQVHGEGLDRAAVVVAIDEAGYDAVAA
jgi:copper chaperone